MKALNAALHEAFCRIALRFGLGSVRESMNSVLTGYLLSPEYAALRERYFGEPVYWTQDRIAAAGTAGGIGLFALLAAIAALFLRARARAANAVRLVRDELETIFGAATSGIVALDPEGNVVRANTQARHLLGGERAVVHCRGKATSPRTGYMAAICPC